MQNVPAYRAFVLRFRVLAPSSISLHPKRIQSYRTGVKHDSDAGAEGLGGQVVVELGSDDATVSVRSGDLAPDDSDLAALSFF